MPDFNLLFLDTEGSEELSEVAILDYNGTLIYEAFNQSHPKNKQSSSRTQINFKPLSEILHDLTQLAQNKTIICHYAEHDRQIIQTSFRKAQIPIPTLRYGCTCELAKQKLPHIASYALEYLSQHLNLKINNRRFNPAQAHTARYDAEFTHQLYLKLQPNMQNPFDSNRVDTPFQTHPDLRNVYEQEFNLLKSMLLEIKSDGNHQSRGAVIIGEAGSGKTHLIMRMAQELLKTNRLLFIRQPNNASAVLHHTYSRILESFAEKVMGNHSYTQLELLIANSLVNILSKIDRFQATQKGKDIINALQNDSLSLYQRLGKESTQKNLDNWQYIERQITDWWNSKYAAAGNSSSILQGIIRFCSYTDPIKKDLTRRWLAAQELEPEACASIGLTNWQEEMSREEFALEAIAVFAKLSILDQPLIIVFDQLEGLGQPHNVQILQSFGESIKEILTHVPNSLIILNLFPDRWQQFKSVFDGSIVDRISQYQVRLNRPSPEKLRQILQIKAGNIQLNTLFTDLELDDILSQNSIRAILNRASAYFRQKHHNIPLPEVVSISPEVRVRQLESLLDQIAQLITSVLPSKISSVGNTKEVDNLRSLSQTRFATPPIDNPLTVEIQSSDISAYFQTQRAELDRNYDRPTIISDADEIGKLATIFEALGKDIDRLRLGKSKLPDHLWIKPNNVAVGFINLPSTNFTPRIRNFNQLTVNFPDYQFHLMRDAREPVINGKVAKEEIAKLEHTPNGKYTIMDKSDRLNFELIYKTIIDVENQDLDIDIATALQCLKLELGEYWLLELV